MDEEFVFCGTNIFKQLSDWLSGYDGLMSFVGLIVEGLFLFFVLKEFAMTRQDFEWTKKDRREEKTKRELCYFAITVIIAYIMKLKECIEEKDEKEVYRMLSNEYIDDYCKEVSDEYFLPISFCKEIMKSALSNAYQDSWVQDKKKIDVNEFYNLLVKTNNEYLFGHVTPRFINKCKKHFSSDEEIDEIYEKLTNIKL